MIELTVDGRPLQRVRGPEPRRRAARRRHDRAALEPGRDAARALLRHRRLPGVPRRRRRSHRPRVRDAGGCGDAGLHQPHLTSRAIVRPRPFRALGGAAIHLRQPGVDCVTPPRPRRPLRRYGCVRVPPSCAAIRSPSAIGRTGARALKRPGSGTPRGDEPLADAPLARSLAAARDDLQRGHRRRAGRHGGVDGPRGHVLAPAQDGVRRGQRQQAGARVEQVREHRDEARQLRASARAARRDRAGAARHRRAWRPPSPRARPRPARAPRRRPPRPRRPRTRPGRTWACPRRARRRRRRARTRARAPARPRA